MSDVSLDAASSTSPTCPLAELRECIDAWRKDRPKPRCPRPESLWEEIVALARGRGLYAVARVLKLDYYSLKERTAAVCRAAWLRRGPGAHQRVVLGLHGYEDLGRGDERLRGEEWLGRRIEGSYPRPGRPLRGPGEGEVGGERLAGPSECLKRRSWARSSSEYWRSPV